MLTKQEMFDKVVERLEDGKGQSKMPCDLCCLYLSKDGNKCAVGIFLPDNKEMQYFHGNVYGLIDKFRNHPDFPQEIPENVGMLLALQAIHDFQGNWNDKKFIGYDKLEEVVEIFELEYERKNS